MNEREHAVLSLFYEEGNREITPSLLAYRMRMSTRDATKLLDGMVKKDLLNLHVDDEGHISYQLPPSERHRIANNPRQSTGQPDRSPEEGIDASGTDTAADGFYARSPEEPASTTSAPGADATPGHGDNQQRNARAQSPRNGRGAGPDGTDGTVGPTAASPVTGWHADGPTTSGTTGGDWHPSGGQQTQPPRGEQRRHPPHHSPPGPGQRRQGQQGQQRRQTQQRQQGRQTRTATQQPEQSAPFHQPEPTNLPARTAGGQNQMANRRVGPRRERIPILAGALSLLIPGLGQFYNGEISKGVMLLFSYVFLIMFWLFWIVHIWSIIDAYMVAEQSNQRSLTDDSDEGQRPLLTERPHQNSNPNSTAA